MELLIYEKEIKVKNVYCIISMSTINDTVVSIRILAIYLTIVLLEQAIGN